MAPSGPKLDFIGASEVRSKSCGRANPHVGRVIVDQGSRDALKNSSATCKGEII